MGLIGLAAPVKRCVKHCQVDLNYGMPSIFARCKRHQIFWLFGNSCCSQLIVKLSKERPAHEIQMNALKQVIDI